MPCLNEALTLERCILEAQSFLARSGVSGEIIIGDNGSTDGSPEIARKLGARVVDVPVRGYGAAIHCATLAARGRYVIVGDSDLSYDFAHLDGFLDKLREGFELVMGNRFQGGIQPGAMPWKNRWIGNPSLTGIGRLLFRCPAGDFHCGLRGFSVDAFSRLNLQTTGMEFASEMVIKATLHGQRIAEIPTVLRPDGRDRPPHLRPWRDGWRHLRFMLLYSPRWAFLYPGLILLFVGLLLTGRLLIGPLTIGGVSFDTHSMLFSGFMALAGYQAVLFGIFSKVYGISHGLLPSDSWMQRFSTSITVERGLILGLILLVAGFLGSVRTVLLWGDASFGPLLPDQLLRPVLASVISIAFGVETIFASLFLGVLGLQLRRDAHI